jgi:hypothetical protein
MEQTPPPSKNPPAEVTRIFAILATIAFALGVFVRLLRIAGLFMDDSLALFAVYFVFAFITFGTVLPWLALLLFYRIRHKRWEVASDWAYKRNTSGEMDEWRARLQAQARSQRDPNRRV